MSALAPPQGWPLGAPDDSGALNWTSGEDCLREALWNLLLTSPGERLMRPSFGAGLRDFLNQPNTETTRQLITNSITRAVTAWETRVTLVDVTVDPDPADLGSVLIDVRYSARASVGMPPSQLSLSLTLGGG
jgi:phage baseplate assembly protein W